jgi:pyruvate dehydrogenase E1 component alpha subunit
MPIETIGKFDVTRLGILDASGTADASLMPELTQAEWKRFFETMVLARTFNQRALSLQREGRIGTYPSFYGQEASQVGSALALKASDWIYPTFRESGVYVAMGYPMRLLFRYWMGDERGMRAPESMNILPMSVPVGTHLPHAAGTALAMKLKGDPSAVVAYFGDGGSSRGDFHEALNIAGVFGVPAVFLCQNNQWAISLPRDKQSAGNTIAERAHCYGFEGLQVDGNDIIAVYKAVGDALEKARSGNGPTLIECFTYRLDDHTTADDASRYRSAEEVESWMKKEPLIRLKLFMEKAGLLIKGYEDQVRKEAEERVDKAIAEAEAFEDQLPSEMLEYTYAGMTGRQKKEAEENGWES